MTFLLRYWRVLAIAAAAALILYAISHFINKAEARGYQRATAEMAASVAAANAATAELERRQSDRIYEVENAHQKALSDLDAKYAAQRLPAVRLCPKPRGGQLPGSAAAAAFDPGPAGSDGLPGRDVTSDFERIARAADEQTQRLIACQAYAASVAK